MGATVLGLLLYNSGTVCDDKFSAYSANAICHEMGYSGQISWASGNKWSIQEEYEIKLDDVRCTQGGEWSSCTYTETDNCSHNEDVFLECSGVGELTLNHHSIYLSHPPSVTSM